MKPQSVALLVAASLAVASSALAHGTTIHIGHGHVKPAEAKAVAGGPIHFINDDEMPGGHTVVADDGSFESPPLAKGEGWHLSIDTPGVVPFHIKEHPNTRGKIQVLVPRKRKR